MITEQPTVSLTFLAHDLGFDPKQVEIAVQLLDEGHSIPFIARYRKDMTGNLDEEHLRRIASRLKELRTLTERKQTILRSIDSLGKLTPELEKKICESRTPRRLEDLYLPYKPKKQTLAGAAREKGLDALALAILNQTESSDAALDLEKRAAEFIDPEKGIATAEEALAGAGHIISELFSEKLELRQRVRDIFHRTARIVSKKSKPVAVEEETEEAVADAAENTPAEATPVEEVPADAAPIEENAAEEVSAEETAAAEAEAIEKAAAEESPVEETPAEETAAGETPAAEFAEVKPAKKGKKAKKKSPAQQKAELEEKLYSDYFDFTSEIRNCPSYRILAIDRGERTKVLRVKLSVNNDQVEEAAKTAALAENHPYRDFLARCLTDALERLVLPSIEREIRNELTENAVHQAVSVFAKNLRNLLLQKPLFRRRVLAIDPGFRYGCKTVALDEFGNILAYETIYITGGAERRAKTAARMAALIEKYNLSVIAIGNGTGCREAEDFVAKMIADHFAEREIAYIIVNEAGASVYSVSPAAKEEFPRYDSLVRGAISIGRRLQDPLNELVKINPANLGVGFYQHDLKAKQLNASLSEVVESCVNYVGVDLNSATPAILEYVAGLNQLVAKRVYEYRVENGPFRYREDLKKVNGLGAVAFENAAGFLKISDGFEPLDATWIHPESYPLAEKILERIGFSKDDLRCPEKRSELTEKISALSVEELAAEFGAGTLTITDILEQFKRPGRDPREAFMAPIFKKGVMKLEDLTPGMELTGTVQNVVDFGAFVDIGLHDSGLIHISRMGSRFVRDAHQCLAVGDLVKVWVVEVDEKRRRISLTMLPPGTERARSDAKSDGSDQKKPFKRPENRENRDRNNANGRSDRPRRESGDGSQSKEDKTRENRPARPATRGGAFGREGRPAEKSDESRSREDRRSDRSFNRNRFNDRPKMPHSTELAAKKNIKPISSEMKSGKAPLRSFSDLAQLFGRLEPTPEVKKEKKPDPAKPAAPVNPAGPEAGENTPAE